MKLLTRLQQLRQEGRKGFAVLIDPDKTDARRTRALAEAASAAGVDYLFVGGSFISADNVSEVVRTLKASCNLPVALFPGGAGQLSPEADAVLLLSLISGRNAELLIGQHVQAAPLLESMQENAQLEIIPTGYMLVESGKLTSATYMSGTLPLPADKPDLAAYTALAGQYLGLQLLYMDAGSGAQQPVSPALIRAVRHKTTVPLIVGGGLRTPETVQRALQAGADVCVIGTALENEQESIAERLAVFAAMVSSTMVVNG